MRHIEQLYPPLLKYITRRVNNREDAKDITQEVFYKLACSQSDRVMNIQSWLYTIAKNTITDYYRTRKPQLGEIEEVPCNETSANDKAVQDLGHCVKSFVNLLPEDYRQVIVMSELENIPQKEIAQRLNMNYVTVRSRIQRGRKKLKELFVECCVITQGGQGCIMDYKPRNRCA